MPPLMLPPSDFKTFIFGRLWSMNPSNSSISIEVDWLQKVQVVIKVLLSFFNGNIWELDVHSWTYTLHLDVV